MEAGTSGNAAVKEGYDFNFIDKLPERLKCPICLCAMRNPVQTKCGHRFCNNCLYGSFSKSKKTECPEDRRNLKKDKGFLIFPDKACEREILSLRVKCEMSKRECNWTGELLNYEGHLTKCQYNDVICEDCNEKMQRRKLGSHMTFDCLERTVYCNYCKKGFAYRCQKGHEDTECPLFPLDCPKSCGVTKIPRKEVEAHMKDVCKKTVVPCPYQGAGCTFQNERSTMSYHVETFTQKHLRLTFSELMKTKKELGDLKVMHEKSNKEINELKKELAQTGRVVERVNKMIVESQQERVRIRTRLDSIESCAVIQEKKRRNPKRRRDEESDEESDVSKRTRSPYQLSYSDDSD